MPYLLVYLFPQLNADTVQYCIIINTNMHCISRKTMINLNMKNLNRNSWLTQCITHTETKVEYLNQPENISKIKEDMA